jgi:hypothetical protein
MSSKLFSCGMAGPIPATPRKYCLAWLATSGPESYSFPSFPNRIAVSVAFLGSSQDAAIEARVPRTIPARHQQASATARGEAAAPACFFARVCQQRAAIEKSGRTVCRECAETRLKGNEYPLRDPSAEPLYLTGRVASEALDMFEEARPGARRELRGDSWS